MQEDSEILEALETLVEPSSRGDPMSALCWTCKSTRRLAKELSQEGHRVSHAKVYQLLRQLGSPIWVRMDITSIIQSFQSLEPTL
ncbi:MAG: hypothetical protein HC768_15420 [Acaryochloris sp. CRU_2_0]|nr:hypothetical protein [Acaryochloris sp. CRU_2_0]